MTIDPPRHLSTALPDRWPTGLAGWAGLFESGPMPVLRSLAEALEECRANEEAVDAHLLSEAFASDPLT